MTRFTDSPYKLFMTQVPARRREASPPPSWPPLILAMAAPMARARHVSDVMTEIDETVMYLKPAHISLDRIV